MNIVPSIVIAAVSLMPMHCSTPEPEPVGYLGGSITQLAVKGYHTLGGDRMWEALRQYGGGTVDEWAKPDSSYWNAFDSAYADRPADVVWWQLAMKQADMANVGGTEDGLYNTAVKVVNLIHEHAPNATVQASAYARFADNTCRGVPSELTSMVERVTARLVANGLVAAGPKMPALYRRDLQDDGCHQDESGQKLHGEVLIDYYG